MTNPLEIFVGYDSREEVAWLVARHWLLRHARGKVQVHHLKQSTLRVEAVESRVARHQRPDPW